MNQKKEERLVRINAIVGRDGVLPIGKSTFWLGVKNGIYPKPIKLGPNITAWRWSDIEHLLEHGISEGGVND